MRILLCSLVIMDTINPVGQKMDRESVKIQDFGVKRNQYAHVGPTVPLVYAIICALLVVVCTNIENCADIRCTNPTDHYCYKCASNNGVALGERGYVNLNTSCERKLNDVKNVQLVLSMFQ